MCFAYFKTDLAVSVKRPLTSKPEYPDYKYIQDIELWVDFFFRITLVPLEYSAREFAFLTWI